MIPDPLFTSTHAITIDAAPEQVWPWIAQMGAGRAGWYSWDAIDNGGTPSASRVSPDLQTVVPGDIMPAIPGATVWERISIATFMGWIAVLATALMRDPHAATTTRW